MVVFPFFGGVYETGERHGTQAILSRPDVVRLSFSAPASLGGRKASLVITGEDAVSFLARSNACEEAGDSAASIALLFEMADQATVIGLYDPLPQELKGLMKEPGWLAVARHRVSQWLGGLGQKAG